MSKKTEKTEEPIKVEIVPAEDAGITETQKKQREESQLPENVANRNASYLPPVDGVNLAEAE